MERKNLTTHNSKLDHRRNLRKDPQLSQEETMIGVLTMELQGILREIAKHLRPITAQRQFVSTAEIEVTWAEIAKHLAVETMNRPIKDNRGKLEWMPLFLKRSDSTQ